MGPLQTAVTIAAFFVLIIVKSGIIMDEAPMDRFLTAIFFVALLFLTVVGFWWWLTENTM